ncbi:MAG: S49 family peptidase [bacterium]
MKTFGPLLGSLYLLALQTFVGAQPIPDYYERYNFLYASPGAFQEGLVGFANPANLKMLHAPEARFYWSTDGTDVISFDDWGLFAGTSGLGFAMQRQHFGPEHVTDYRLSTASGNDGFALGLSYGWSSGDQDAFAREKQFTAGMLLRPSRYFSLGMIGSFSVESSAREGVGELGIRPLGTPRLTLFGDLAMQKNTQRKQAPWSAGAVWQIAPGLNFIGRAFKNDAFTLGVFLNFGRDGIGAQTHFNDEREHAYNSYMMRLGGMRPSFFQTALGKGKRYLPVSLKGRVDYQKYVWFDNDTHRLLDILTDIRAAAEDARVGAIALNLSTMRILPEHAWEVREALRQARNAGKKILAFLDNADMTSYHLASVADEIVLDPEGMLMLEGYVLGRTFFKGTLEKLGLGFDEWRFFKYKSAAEVLSQEEMSAADREQRQAFVDDWYETVRAEICASRKLEASQFDQLIDEEVVLLAERAMSAGLVDTLARWSALQETIKAVNGRSMRKIAAPDLYKNAVKSERWGRPAHIAVVYGLGECALDTGIRARWLERVFLRLATDSNIKAVVFRVDSPGGDGLASDLVAEAIKKCKKEKPVIVSQGQVAGSGGYWISMYGDTIVAAPQTVTGSIGVIGGWLYDKGVGEKLGMTSDHVQRGKHADLGFGITLPILGAQIPARNLTVAERERVEILIKKFYENFLNKVAAGRRLPVEEVKRIAEGHFYSGLEGKANGLVDELGGLFTALALAKQRAGLDESDEVEIVEIPRYKGWFDLHSRFSPLGARLDNDPVLQYLKMASTRNGQPLPMMLPGTYPTLY